MLNQPKLTAEKVAQFQEQGFLPLKGAFGSGDTESIRGWATEIAESPEKVGKHWVYHETSLRDGTKKLINRIENMTPFHQGLAS